MAFTPGHKKHGGRQKGTVNNDKKDIVEKINKLWEGYSEEQMLTDLLKLEAPERLKIMLGMAAEFCAPKLARVEQTGNTNTQTTVIIAPYEQGSKSTDQP